MFLKVLTSSKLTDTQSICSVIFLKFSLIAFIQCFIIWPFNSFLIVQLVIVLAPSGNFLFMTILFYYIYPCGQPVLTENLLPRTAQPSRDNDDDDSNFIYWINLLSMCTKHFTCDIWLNSHKGSLSVTEKETKAKMV